MKVEQGQSFLDLVIQATGDIDNAFEMALKNGIGITKTLTIGQEIEPIPVTNKRVFQEFNELNKPATAWNEKESPLILEGISYWIINQDFIVQ